MELAAIALQIDHGDYRFRNEGASYEPYRYLPPKVGFGEILKTFKCLSYSIHFKKISLDLFPRREG